MNSPFATSAAELEQLIAVQAALGQGHTAELLRAARRGEIAMALPPDRGFVPLMAQLKHATRPVLAVIGDDDGASTGPAGWASAAPLLRWSRWTVIHAAGAEVSQYRDIAAATRRHRRVLLVETSRSCLGDWIVAHHAAAKPHLPRGCVIVPPGLFPPGAVPSSPFPTGWTA